MDKHIRFTSHAEEKLVRLTEVGVTKEKKTKTIEYPEKLTKGYSRRKIAQSSLSNALILRVVYEEIENEILVITVFPCKRRRYEDKV